MNFGKRILLGAYYHATLPRRRAEERFRCAQGSDPVRILFYHRIADDHPNPWTMRRRQFTQQIDWIADRYEVISLAEAQQRIASGTNDRPAVAITFDDGYADNVDHALPLLLDKKLPFTYFVTTANVMDQKPFPHDARRGAPLAPNTPADIQALAESGVEIGAHTRTHADLGRIDLDQLANEIVGSKTDLEQIIGSPVRYFAFPFGQHENMTLAGMCVAREAGFAGVCSAYGGYNFPGNNAFHLQRIHADPEIIRLKNWLSVDQRKLRSTVPFEIREEAHHGGFSTDDNMDAVRRSALPLVTEGSC
ncbi:MAG: polysaccharide deacetylase family protein [Aeoliella sp.]